MSAPEPVMDDREAMHRERSRRYAEALAAAAAADARVKELTEKLEETEYLRRIAEDEAGAASWINDDGSDPWRSNIDTHVYHVGEPEPADDREYAFSLADGTIWRALRWKKTEHNPEPARHGWHRVGYHSMSQGDWSAVLEHAPLLCFTRETDWGLDAIVRDITRHMEVEEQFRRRLPRDPEKPSYDQNDLPSRLTVLEHQHVEQYGKQRAEIDRLTRDLRTANADTDTAMEWVERFAEAIRSGDVEQMRVALVRWDETRPTAEAPTS